MHSIFVPKLNNNDESCILVEWLHKDNTQVYENDTIAILETSKATTDLECSATGILHQLVAPQDECLFGALIAYVFEDAQEMQHFLDTQNTSQPLHTSKLVQENGIEQHLSASARTSTETSPEETPSTVRQLIITKDAQDLITAKNITQEDLYALRKKIIKKADIITLLEQRTAIDSQSTPLSRRQAAIAETVSISHQTIPRAMAQIKVYCNQARAVLDTIMDREDLILGLPEVLIKLVAATHQDFPDIFSHLTDNTHLMRAQQPQIGITIDVGTGLFIPVIHNADKLSLIEIASICGGYRMKAMRTSFTEEDLNAGNITISLHTDTDIIFALPIILPAQAAMITLCSQQKELYLTSAGAVAERYYCHLGLAYDHRIINGADAMRFLKTLKQRLETLDEKSLA